MRTKIQLLFGFLLTTAFAFAQIPDANQLQNSTNQLKTVPSAPSVPTANQGVGKLVGELTNNINPSSFTDAFAKNKPEFVNKANGTTTPSAAGGLLQYLANGLKPSSFTSGWPATKAKWMEAAKSASTQKQVGDLLSQLESNINPKSLSSTWAKVKPMWEAGLKKL